jgi:hypothetical protein
MKSAGFNPHARWDRHIPETGDSENHTCLEERIDVLAWFKNAKIHPRMFIWKNKKYKIHTITYNWQEHHGQERINYFSVNTGPDLYQISFNNTSYTWKLDKIIT